MGTDGGVERSETSPPGLLLPELPEPVSNEFVDLYEANYSRLVAVMRAVGAGSGEAEDLAQEAFARTLRHWRRVRNGPNPAGYLYRVAFRLLRHRIPLTDDPIHQHDAVVPGHEDETLTRLSARAVIDALPSRRRACAILCLELGFRADQAAAILDIDPATVRKQVELTRRALRNALRVTTTE